MGDLTPGGPFAIVQHPQDGGIPDNAASLNPCERLVPRPRLENEHRKCEYVRRWRWPSVPVTTYELGGAVSRASGYVEVVQPFVREETQPEVAEERIALLRIKNVILPTRRSAAAATE